MAFISDENIKKHDSNWNTEPDGIFLGMFTSFTKETSEDLVLIMVD